MNGFVELLKKIFGRVGEFFDVIDLSFFLSGAACFGAIAFWAHREMEPIFEKLGAGFTLIVVVVSCYLLGLLCLALGNWLRRYVSWAIPSFWSPVDRRLIQAVGDHGLWKEAPFKDFPELEDGKLDSWKRYSMAMCLYRRLWAELRESEHLKASFSFLERKWVMQATYDGLAMALLVWWFVVFRASWLVGVESRLAPEIGIPLDILLIILVLTCWREASRAFATQVGELVATVAYNISNKKQEPDSEGEQSGPDQPPSDDATG